MLKLVKGFRSVGDVPDSGICIPVERPSDCPFPVFASSNASWVLECRRRVLSSAKCDPARARACYQRTMQELDSGLVHGPFSVSNLIAKPGTWKNTFDFGRWRPLPRFAIWQGSKWRCIYDAASSRNNAAGTSTHETICCDRPDTLVRIGLRFH